MVGQRPVGPRVSPMVVKDAYFRARLAAMTGRRSLAPFEVHPAFRVRANNAIRERYERIGKKAKYTAWTPW